MHCRTSLVFGWRRTKRWVFARIKVQGVTGVYMKETHTRPNHIVLSVAGEALKMFLWIEIKLGKLETGNHPTGLAKQIKAHARLTSTSHGFSVLFQTGTSAVD